MRPRTQATCTRRRGSTPKATHTHAHTRTRRAAYHGLAEPQLLAEGTRRAVEVGLRLLGVGLGQDPAGAVAVLASRHAPPHAGAAEG